MRILLPAVLDGYNRRKDRSATLRFVTRELTTDEVTAIDSMFNQYGVLYFKEGDEVDEDEVAKLDEMDIDLYDKPKTPSMRLRGVLYRLWVQNGEQGEFKDFYKVKMEQLINHFKDKLE